MKKHILAISIVVLMLFASCDGELASIMEKFGDNVVGTYVPEQTVGNEAPAKEEAQTSTIGMIIYQASSGQMVATGDFVSGISDADKANLIDLGKNNAEAIDSMKVTGLTEKQAESAEAVVNTAATLASLVNSKINVEDIQASDAPENVKNLVAGLVESVNAITEKQPEELTQADVVGMQAVAGLVNDIATCIEEPIVVGEGEEAVTVTSENVLNLVISGGTDGGGVDADDVVEALTSSAGQAALENIISTATSNLDILNLMGMTGGVSAGSLISGFIK